MPMCSRCHRNEATIRLITIVNESQEVVHLCKDCAAGSGLDNIDPSKLEALSLVGKACEFCGREAYSGVAGANPICWCYECGLEFGRILVELYTAERPEMMQRNPEELSLFSLCCDPELQARAEAIIQKAAQILKERGRHDGRDQTT